MDDELREYPNPERELIRRHDVSLVDARLEMVMADEIMDRLMSENPGLDLDEIPGFEAAVKQHDDAIDVLLQTPAWLCDGLIAKASALEDLFKPELGYDLKGERLAVLLAKDVIRILGARDTKDIMLASY